MKLQALRSSQAPWLQVNVLGDYSLPVPHFYSNLTDHLTALSITSNVNAAFLVDSHFNMSFAAAVCLLSRHKEADR